MNQTIPPHLIDLCNRISLTAMTDTSSGSSHRCHVMRGSSTILMISDHDVCPHITYKK